MLYPLYFRNSLLCPTLLRLLGGQSFQWPFLYWARLLSNSFFFRVIVTFFTVFEDRSFIHEPRIIWFLIINWILYSFLAACSNKIIFRCLTFFDQLKLVLFYRVVVFYFVSFTIISESLSWFLLLSLSHECLIGLFRLYLCLNCWFHSLLDLKLLHNLQSWSGLFFLILHINRTISGQLIYGWLPQRFIIILASMYGLKLPWLDTQWQIVGNFILLRIPPELIAWSTYLWNTFVLIGLCRQINPAVLSVSRIFVSYLVVILEWICLADPAKD